jgi:UDP-N-acetylmuramate--alanine ligase
VILQAIRESNVELKAVRKHGLHVVNRAEALAAMMAGYRSVAVAGTHSKSNTRASGAASPARARPGACLWWTATRNSSSEVVITRL